MSNFPFFACIHFHILILFQDASCAAAPCGNGATCSNHGKDYKCTCAAGYTGKQCEIRSKYKYLKVLGEILLRHLCTIHIPTRIVAEMELHRSVMPQKCLTIFMSFFFTLIRLQERALLQEFT
jgi:hypothetical protein